MIDLVFLLADVTMAAAILQPFVRASQSDRSLARPAEPPAGRVEGVGAGWTLPRPGAASPQPVRNRAAGGARRRVERMGVESRLCGAPGSLGNHPMGPPDWAGRTACPCGLVRVYPPGADGLPDDPPDTSSEAADWAAQPHWADRKSLVFHARTGESARRTPNPNRRQLFEAEGPHAVVFDLDAARRVKLRRTF
jgi:hypothetical protein